MDVPEGAFAYGAYAYGPGVGLRIASDYFCEGKKKKILYELTRIKRKRKIFPSKCTGFKLSQHL